VQERCGGREARVGSTVGVAINRTAAAAQVDCEPIRVIGLAPRGNAAASVVCVSIQPERAQARALATSAHPSLERAGRALHRGVGRSHRARGGLRAQPSQDALPASRRTPGRLRHGGQSAPEPAARRVRAFEGHAAAAQLNPQKAQRLQRLLARIDWQR